MSHIQRQLQLAPVGLKVADGLQQGPGKRAAGHTFSPRKMNGSRCAVVQTRADCLGIIALQCFAACVAPPRCLSVSSGMLDFFIGLLIPQFPHCSHLVRASCTQWHTVHTPSHASAATYLEQLVASLCTQVALEDERVIPEALDLNHSTHNNTSSYWQEPMVAAV